MGILSSQADERIKQVQVSEEMLTVSLMDGRIISVPLHWYPALINSSREQLEDYQVSGGGYGIHWSQLDEDLSVEGLLKGLPAPKSFNKTA
ncbi:MAG: DUF2442 domain-containing protein [Ignavibacteria bacterium]|nr:DUF2442 domain-containing protein [Ignavibacteria bacterium]